MEVTFQKNNVKNSNKFLDKIVKFFKNTDSNFYFFWFLCLMGFIFFIDSLLQNQFTTLFGGDYTSQQLSFYTNGYDDWWTFFKTGKFVWFDTNTYLGASNLGANSFYYLFDPFFLPILICPREFIAQGMAINTIFKIATAGMFFLWYMTYMGASKRAARISAFAYAFSGWMAWFLWFNHMTEITIIFPLMLLGVEKVLKTKKPWLLMISTMMMGITNYFFLIGMGLAAFFYAIFRWAQRFKENTLKDNFLALGVGFVGFLTGLLLSGFAVLPSVISSLEAPRATNSGYLDNLKDALKGNNWKLFFSLIFEWKNQSFGGDPSTFRHLYPIMSFFFPCASCRGTPLAQYGNEWYDNVATNIYSYVPMMLFFFPAFVKSMKKKKWSVIVAIVLFLFALETPFFYFLFFGFTAPYGRWELFFVTSFITFSGLHIDDAKDDPIWTKITSYGLVIALVIVAGAVSQHLIDTNEDFIQRSEYITATGATILMCLYVSVVFLSTLFIKKEESRYSWNMVFIALEAAVMGFLTIEGHWCTTFYEANNGLEYNNDLYKVAQKVQKEDKSYFRCWTYLQNESGRNDGMRNNYNGLGCFHSLYNFNLNNFLNWTRIQDGNTFYGSGSWAGSYVWKNSDIDKFLGVKYYFIQKNSPQWGWMSNGGNDTEYQYNRPLGYVDVSDRYQSPRFEVFEDTKPVNFAMAYNDLISYQLEENSDVEALYSEFNFYTSSSVLRNDEELLEGAIVNVNQANELVAKYPNLTVTPNLSKRSFGKRLIMDLKVKYYDLTLSNDGEKYTCNTFFEDYAQRWLGGAHALTSTQLINVDNGKFQEVTTLDQQNDIYGRYVSVISPEIGTWNEIYDPKGYSMYVPYSYDDGYGSDIYLISDNNKIVTWDRHQDDKYAVGGEKYRGFYVHGKLDNDGNVIEPAPKVVKIIVSHREKKFTQSFGLSRIFTEKYSEQELRYAHLYENAPYDVVYRTNGFKFKTNNAENMVMVTQMPWEQGWTLKAKTSDGKKKTIELFPAQGGYTSFVCEKGVTEYVLDFYPANLAKGALLSVIGATMFIATLGGYMFYSKTHSKKKENIEEIAA